MIRSTSFRLIAPAALVFFNIGENESLPRILHALAMTQLRLRKHLERSKDDSRVLG